MVMQCNVSLICWMETMSNTMSTITMACHRTLATHIVIQTNVLQLKCKGLTHDRVPSPKPS